MHPEVVARAESARAAAAMLAGIPTEAKNNALRLIAAALNAQSEKIIKANAEDLQLYRSSPCLLYTSLLVVQSVLEDAGIRYYARGAGLQNLFALGTMGGFNPLTGPVQIQVNRDDAAAAAQLLKDLAEKS